MLARLVCMGAGDFTEESKQMFEKDLNIHDIKEIRTRTTVYFGVGAIQKIADIAKDLKGRGINKVIVMSGRNAYKSTGAWDYVEKALKAEEIGYINFDKVTPNPTTHHVDEAVKMARDFGAQAVIAIGGGSPTDAGKSVAILLEYPGKTASELYEFAFTPTKAAPIVSINLTHGTGTETNRFAVVTVPEKDFKPAIAYDCIYPLYAIDDPQLMVKLSPNQSRYVSVDAVNHVVEAATTKVMSPYSITLAREVISLVHKYLPRVNANPEDLEARYYLAYAAMIAGVSFDNGLLHYTHALEHPLSAVKHELAHGLGLAMLLPAVIRTIYKDRAHVLAEILKPINPDLEGDPSEAYQAAKSVQDWLFSIGITSKLEDEGFTADDVEKLTNLVYTTPSLSGLLEVGPSGSGRDIVEGIYRDSIKPL